MRIPYFLRVKTRLSESCYGLHVEPLEDRVLLATVDSNLLDRASSHFDELTAREGLAVINLSSSESTVFNGSQVFGTSSTIKLGVLYALMRLVDSDQNVDLTTTLNVGTQYGTNQGNTLSANTSYTLRELAETMITHSNNWATNRLINYIAGLNAPGVPVKVNQEYQNLGLSNTRIDRYMTGVGSPSMHGLSGPFGDYCAGHDNESTPNEMSSLVRQIHENNGLLTQSSYDAYWDIMQNGNPDGRVDLLVSGTYDNFVFSRSLVNDSWTDLMTIGGKAGSNNWIGNVGDFTDDPTLATHYQRSEAGRIVVANGEVVIYAMFVDELEDDGMDGSSGSASLQHVGYEIATEFANAPGTATPSGAELEDGTVLTVRGTSAADTISFVVRSFDPDYVDLTVNGTYVRGVNVVDRSVDIANIFGFGLDDQITVGGDLSALAFTTHVNGNSGSDTINGPNFANIWTINGSNSGELNSGAVVFVNTENFNGGINSDDFHFQALGAIGGRIDGNAGFDVLNFALIGSVQMNLTGLGSAGGANGFNGTIGGGSPVGEFSDIDRAIGSSTGTFDELKGINGPALWTYVGATGSYLFQSRTLSFQNMEVLTGGTLIDRFTVRPLTTSTLFVNGNLPTVLPGDLLKVDLVGVSNPQLVVTGPGNGLFTFALPHQPIVYTSIERLDVFDYGDAPATYGTTTTTGARHRLGSNLKLGAFLDPDPNGQPSGQANKDDVTGLPDDEDGVLLPTNLVAQFRGGLVVNASGPGKLDAWIDFDANGVFDPYDQVVTSVPVIAGDNRIEFSVPDWAVAGSRYARFRLSTAGGLGPTGQAEDGEVEDYKVFVLALTPGAAVVLDDPLAPVESKKMLFVAGTSSKEEIIVEPFFDDDVRVVLTGKPIFGPSPISPIQRIGVLGGSSNDRLIINNQLTIPAEIHGGFGNDVIFSALGDDYLDGGSDDDVIYALNGKDIVYGRAGNDVLYGMGCGDVLLGGSGDDLMYGGGGRDLLIGGNGSDREFGEVGDDLLIGGSTVYDNTWVPLQKLLSEWYSARIYEERRFNVRTGSGPILGGTGLSLVAGVEVKDDGSEDRLYGGADRDWFYEFDLANSLPDLEADELVN